MAQEIISEIYFFNEMHKVLPRFCGKSKEDSPKKNLQNHFLGQRHLLKSFKKNTFIVLNVLQDYFLQI